MPAQRNVGEPIVAAAEVLSRVFDAPRALVFEVWTKVEHFTRWFGPHGADVVSCEIDPRPGGIIRFGHRFGEGTTLLIRGTFREVVQDQRLVFTLGFVDERGRPTRHPMFTDLPLEMLLETTVLLEDVPGGTRVRVAQRVTPPGIASQPAVIRHLGLACEGWKQVFERLGEHLSATQGREDRPA
jgi:uncharacterized protein YndB with AHSA1/START domain